MSSDFTLDIQLTELGFSSCDLHLCAQQSVKNTFLPTHNRIEKSVPGTRTLPNSHEDPRMVPSESAGSNVLQDHQYSSPVKQDSVVIAGKPQDNPGRIITEVSEKSIYRKWNLGTKRQVTERIDDEQCGDDEGSASEKDQGSEVSEETNSLQIYDRMSGEEKTDEDADFNLTDDEEEMEEEDEEEEEEEEMEEEIGDDDVSYSETTGPGESGDKYCHVCDVTFPSLFLFREHLNMHTGVRPYRCDECSKQFCQLVNYRTHLRSHSQKASIHCKVCSTIFETEEQLTKHLDTNHFEDEFYQCDFCKQIFTDLEVCKEHVEKHRQQVKRHMCLKCGYSFRHRKSLLRHLHLQWHSRGVFTCPDCERPYSTKASLLRHSFSHSGVLPYTCSKCKRHFRLPSLYHSHECKPEHVQCMACLVFFQSSEDFDKHKKDTGCWGHQEAMSSKTDKIRCMECGQVCASVEELKKHGSTHQRVLKCAECGMGFRSSLMLMSHMGGHAAQRPCLCKDCGLGFPHQQGYDSHLKTCGLVSPPMPTSKKPKPKKNVSPQKNRPFASNAIFQAAAAKDSNLIPMSDSKMACVMPLGDQKQPADGLWKITLPKDSPTGVPLVMLLPFSVSQALSTSDPIKISQNTSPLVLQTQSSAKCVLSMPVGQPSSVICEEAQKDVAGQSRASIPANILIPIKNHVNTDTNTWTILEDKHSHGDKQEEDVVQGLNVTAQMEAEDEQKKKSNLIKHDNSSGLNDLDSLPVMAEAQGTVPLTITSEKQTHRSSVTSSEIAFDKGQLKHSNEDHRLCKETVSPDNSVSDFTSTGAKSNNFPQEGNTCDLEVDVDGETELEIGDEDSGVDMLEGELHECVTCGQILPEKEMIQHYMKHATDSPKLSPNKCASYTTDQSPSCRKRQRSETEL